MKLRIFVIDDEQSIRDTFKWYLEDQGHEVFTASEPLLCSHYSCCDCEQKHPCGDLMLIDYYMPRMTGLEFLEILEQRGCKGALDSRILMTGDISSVDIKRVEALGCRILEKPFSFQVLDELINDTIARTDLNRILPRIDSAVPGQYRQR